jgi:hypothetical protein
LNSLNSLGATNLPIYISELDLDLSDNTQHLNRMQEIFPLFYEHASVKGITLWGYIKGETNIANGWLYDENAGGYVVTCTLQNLQSNIALSWGVWNDYTVLIPSTGKIRAVFANDGTTNSEIMAVDYAIIDGVKYEAEDQAVNIGVWNGDTCGGSYSQLLHCPGYIEFPEGSSNVTIRAKAVDKGGEQMTIQLASGCTSSGSQGLPYERNSLKWLKYVYLPTITASKKSNTKFKVSISGSSKEVTAGFDTDCDGSTVSYSYTPSTTAGSYDLKMTVLDKNGDSNTLTQTVAI